MYLFNDICRPHSVNSEWRQKINFNRRCLQFINNWVGAEFNTLFTDRPHKRKRPGVVHSRRAKTLDDFTNTAWMQLIRNPLTTRRNSYFGKLFRNRFRIPFPMFVKLRSLFVERNWLQTRKFDCKPPSGPHPFGPPLCFKKFTCRNFLFKKKLKIFLHF